MGFDQYHEPADELSQETRTFARMITSLIEEAEAIGWYEQRMSLEKDKEAKAIMANAQKEEFKHFGMNLEFLLRRKKDWRTELQGILFTEGDIVELAEKAEKKVDRRVPMGGPHGRQAQTASVARFEGWNDLVRRGGDIMHRAQSDQVGRHAGRHKPARRPQGIHVGDLVRGCSPRMPDRLD